MIVNIHHYYIQLRTHKRQNNGKSILQGLIIVIAIHYVWDLHYSKFPYKASVWITSVLTMHFSLHINEEFNYVWWNFTLYCDAPWRCIHFQTDNNFYSTHSSMGIALKDVIMLYIVVVSVVLRKRPSLGSSTEAGIHVDNVMAYSHYTGLVQ